ncbi:MAG: hypothetical protein JKX96_04290, partial [Acinetobacter sp.]|nr:hypothetical protein [Acinetobacter sp.]
MQTEKITEFLGLFLPEAGTEGWVEHYLNDKHIQDAWSRAVAQQHQLISGEFTSGQLKNVVVQFGTGQPQTFPDISVVISSDTVTTEIPISDTESYQKTIPVRSLWYADQVSGTIQSINLPGAATLALGDGIIPLLHVGKYQSSGTQTTDFTKFIAPMENLAVNREAVTRQMQITDVLGRIFGEFGRRKKAINQEVTDRNQAINQEVTD